MKKILEKNIWEELSSQYNDYDLYKEKQIDKVEEGSKFDKKYDVLFKVRNFEKKDSEKISGTRYNYWKAVFKSVMKSKSFIVCLLLLILTISLAIIIPWGKPAGADSLSAKPDGDLNPEAPSSKHIFGLGVYGDDYWIQMWYGTRTTLLFTLFVASIQIFLGIFLGSIWGYYRKIDVMFIEFTRLLNIIPTIILWLVIIFVFNSYSIAVIVFAVSITSWIDLANVIRTQIILIKNSEYNIASHTLGSSGPKIIKRNILPKILPVVTQTACYAVPMAISIDATLSYYGFGFVSQVSLKNASLGSILQQVFQDDFWKQYPHLLIFPAIFITGISSLFFIMGKVFADSLDPKNHN
ncbi:oligopeptide ABC transporter permease OppC [Spiroplasma endosymbiont of Aspidapion aeneum]|uniref:oligopeptide ABC transporter permease OppC n=1 Tax=Spiroplasma endosymbiont of Aspidapion aeneum TaxID=3066276 RepID=UPI00313F303D